MNKPFYFFFLLYLLCISNLFSDKSIYHISGIQSSLTLELLSLLIFASIIMEPIKTILNVFFYFFYFIIIKIIYGTKIFYNFVNSIKASQKMRMTIGIIEFQVTRKIFSIANTDATFVIIRMPVIKNIFFSYLFTSFLFIESGLLSTILFYHILTRL